MIRRHRQALERARRILRPRQQEMAILTAVELMLGLLLILSGDMLERWLFGSQEEGLSLRDLYALCCMAGSAFLTAPLTLGAAWRLADTAGLLDESDEGFLRCNSKLWLWGRWGLLQLFLVLLTLCALIPTAVCFGLSEAVFSAASLVPDGTLVLLLSAHLILFGILFLFLPLRMLTIKTALSLCFLKSPHIRLSLLLLQALTVTRGNTASLCFRRMLCAPFLLFPFTALHTLPALRITELRSADRRLMRLLRTKKAFS